MGWASGSEVMDEIIEVVQKEIKDPEIRFRLYKGIIVALEGRDWDTQGECEGTDDAFDKALMALHPDWSKDGE